MDTNEMIALSAVAIAALLLLKCFLGKKGGGCCGSDCSSKPGQRSDVPKK